MLKKWKLIVILGVFAYFYAYPYYQSKTLRSWHKPVHITIYAINGDKQEDTESYITKLWLRKFDDIKQYLETQAQEYNTPNLPKFILEVVSLKDISLPQKWLPWDNFVGRVVWSIQLRRWAENNFDTPFASNTIRILAHYSKNPINWPVIDNMPKLQGLMRVSYLTADNKKTDQNNVFLTHLILEVLGASIKYDSNGQPLIPQGLANPEQTPLYPQLQAEIMAGRIPLGETESILPLSLSSCIVGANTAKEINWIN